MDHRPPTSTAHATTSAQFRCPANSGALSYAWPPGERHHISGSHHSRIDGKLATSKRGRPPTTTSNLLPSACGTASSKVANHHVGTNTTAGLSANSSCSTLQSTRSAMMAKRVELTATAASAHGRWVRATASVARRLWPRTVGCKALSPSDVPLEHGLPSTGVPCLKVPRGIIPA